MDAPSLSTARLTMVPHRLADFAEICAMQSDPAVMHFLEKGLSREDSWIRLQRQAGSWALLGFGMWVVRVRDSGAFVGEVGFLDGQRTGVTGFDGDPEIGWVLAASAHGQGYASEAVRGALDWGAARFRRVVAMTHPDNAASIAVASRYKDAPTGLWEWRAT